MKIISHLAIGMLMLAITACTKSSSPEENPPVVIPDVAATTDIGSTDGVLASKTIGSAGGTVISSDGGMELIIPAGALITNTEITIQPLINKCPNGLNKAYRCLPDGQQFAKDITIRFRYTVEQLAQTNADYMGIAFQNKSRQWEMIKMTTNETSSRIISATLNHFTDFTAFDLLDLSPAVSYVKPNQTKNFMIHSIAPVGLENAGQLLSELIRTPPVWKINGITGGNTTLGTITPMSGQEWIQATYKAPATAPSSGKVELTAELNIPFTINGKKFNKGILFATINITTDFRFNLHFEVSGNSACNHIGQSEYDDVDMNVIIKGDSVFVDNIRNRAPSAILPGTISIGSTPDFQCQLTGSTGKNGFINITKVEGSIEEDPGDNKRLILNMINSGSDNNNCTTVCPGLPPVVQPSQIVPDYELPVVFVLKDSAQQQGNKPGFFWKLTPAP